MTEDAASVAAAAMQSSVQAQITTDGGPGADLPPVMFPRLSLERRVLAFITDEVDGIMGPRNTLPALTYALKGDPHTTNPPEPNGRLDVEGKTDVEIVRQVLDVLERLIEAGLVSRHGDVTDPKHTYHVLKAGAVELGS